MLDVFFFKSLLPFLFITHVLQRWHFGSLYFFFPSQIQRGRIDPPHIALPKAWARRKAEAKLPHPTWFKPPRRDTSVSLFSHGHAVPPNRESACISTPDLKFSWPSDPESQGPLQRPLEGPRVSTTLHEVTSHISLPMSVLFLNLYLFVTLFSERPPPL